jgi:hypothetical protein
VVDQEVSATLLPPKLGAVVIVSTTGAVINVMAAAVGGTVVASKTSSILLEGTLQLQLLEAPAAEVFQ